MSPFSPAGFIVSWHVPSVVNVNDLRTGVALTGRNSMEFVPDLKPASLVSRSAGFLARALATKDTRRLARKVEHTKRQITAEHVDASGLTYSRDAAIEYDETTGKLKSDVFSTSNLDPIAREIDSTRKAGDVTRVVQRIVEEAGSDLIPVRENGGAYFIPAGHRIIDDVRTVLEAVGGSMMQFACTIGHGADADRTGQSVATVITDYLLKNIEELRTAVEELGERHIRSDVRRNRLTRVSELRDRLHAYASLIGASGERIEQELARAEEVFLAKLAKQDADDESEQDAKDASFEATVGGEREWNEVAALDPERDDQQP